MSPAQNSKKSLKLSFFQGVLPLKPSQVPWEITAGIAFAAVAIPQVMGYTKIAGMPLVTGIYTILLPMIAFAIFGSSRHLAVGADSATSAIIASGLIAIAIPESQQYIAYASMIALLAAILLLLAGLLQLGFLADFLSHTILIGFLTGVGIQITLFELSEVLGIPHELYRTSMQITPLHIISLFKYLYLINVPTFIVSSSVIMIITLSRKVSKKVPGALLAMMQLLQVGH